MEETTLRHLITERLAKEPINLLTEYGKIHRMFYKGGLYHYHCQHFVVGVFDQFSLSFHEFNDKYGFKFELKPNMDMSVDKLIDLCEETNGNEFGYGQNILPNEIPNFLSQEFALSK